MRAIIICLLLLLWVNPSSSENPTKAGWSITNVEEHVIHSTISNQDLRLFIRLPLDYQQSKESYSVVYYMDGHAYKGTTAEIMRLLEAGNEVPKLVLVGIDSDEIDSYEEWYRRRSINLTPTSAATYEDYGILASDTGGGDLFLKTLTEEIIPFVDSTYRTRKDDRTLMGHSFGGLFVLSTLFSQYNNVFSRYLSSSPSLPWDDRVIFKRELAYAKKHSDLPFKLYMSMGSLENEIGDMVVYHLQELASTLELRSYSGLKITSEIREGESHYSIPFSAFSRGLRFLYSDE